MDENLIIRKATISDVSEIMKVIDEAKAFLREQGLDQWQFGYPNAEAFYGDIEKSSAYVFIKDGRISGVLTLMLEKDSVYEEKKVDWISKTDYATIHRMAVSKAERGTGLSAEMLSFACDEAKKSMKKSVRIDTHRGNQPMKRLLQREQFEFICEIDYHFQNGDPIRLAFEKAI